MTMDLSKLSLGELKKLQNDIDALIADQAKEALAKARKDILAIAQSVGLTVDQLFNGGGQPKPPKKVAPQYCNPKNNTEKWSGRGRKPGWVIEALDTGSSFDDLKI